MLDANGPALTPGERRKIGNISRHLRKGYAWAPGTGPAGEKCGTCCHFVRKRSSRTYLKCGLARTDWTGGTRSDVYARSPACKFWEMIVPEEAGVEMQECVRGRVAA